MDSSSDTAELSALRTTLDEAARRIEAMADRYARSPDSAVAAELFTAERALVAAGRALHRASRSLGAT